MKIVREKQTNRVIYAFADGEPCDITNQGMITPNITALDIRPETHEIVENVAEPPAYVGGAIAYDGAWTVVNQTAIDEKIAEQNAATIARYTAALDAHIDAVAQSDRWDSRITCALRAAYPNQWQAKGIAFGEWMDACYALAYQIMADVQAQTRTLPTIDAFLAEMPVMEWPA